MNTKPVNIDSGPFSVAVIYPQVKRTNSYTFAARLGRLDSVLAPQPYEVVTLNHADLP